MQNDCGMNQALRALPGKIIDARKPRFAKAARLPARVGEGGRLQDSKGPALAHGCMCMCACVCARARWYVRVRLCGVDNMRVHMHMRCRNKGGGGGAPCKRSDSSWLDQGVALPGC